MYLLDHFGQQRASHFTYGSAFMLMASTNALECSSVHLWGSLNVCLKNLGTIMTTVKWELVNQWSSLLSPHWMSSKLWSAESVPQRVLSGTESSSSQLASYLISPLLASPFFLSLSLFLQSLQFDLWRLVQINKLYVVVCWSRLGSVHESQS